MHDVKGDIKANSSPSWDFISHLRYNLLFPVSISSLWLGGNLSATKYTCIYWEHLLQNISLDLLMFVTRLLFNSIRYFRFVQNQPYLSTSTWKMLTFSIVPPDTLWVQNKPNWNGYFDWCLFGLKIGRSGVRSPSVGHV